MKKGNEFYSPFIERGILGRLHEKLYFSLFRWIFRRIKIDEESLIQLQELGENSGIAYASMQSSQTSLYLQLSLLEKTKYPVPKFSMGFRPSILHKLFGFILSIIFVYRKFLKKSSSRLVTDREFFKKTIEENGSIIFSMMSVPLFQRSYVENKNGAIEYLIDLQLERETPLYIFPQVIFWNRNPERADSIFSMNPTGDNGLIRAIISVFKSSTPGFMRVCSPLNLKKFLDANSGKKREELVHLVREALFANYNKEKRIILGPHVKTKQEMMESVLDNENVLSVIDEEVGLGKKSLKKLRSRAYKYYREIAADFSIVWLMVFRVVSLRFLKKIFNDFHYNTEDFKRIREWAKKGNLVLVPSHKSHIDYVILSNLFFRNNFTPPHIVAGANLSFFPLGKIFRKSGAFFMRRSFKGNKLYSVVFRQYVKSLVAEGYPIEFFIEGGRSRTGKIISPKMGIVKYLVESIEEGYGEDLIFVPITVNYDRIMEEGSYKKELRGKEKTKESTSSFFKSRKLIKKRYGDVYIGVNEPFSMKEYKAHLLKLHGAEREEEFISDLGAHIVRKINEVVMVTPFALVSAAILHCPKEGFSVKEVLHRVTLLLEIVKFFNARLAPILEEGDLNAILENVIASYLNDDIIRTLDDQPNDAGDELFALSDEERIKINFYKNSILYFTLPVNLVSLALVATREEKGVKPTELKKSFSELRELLSREFDYPEILDESTDIFKRTLQLMEDQGIVQVKSGVIRCKEESCETLKFLASVIKDFLESKLIVFTLLKENRGKEFEEKALLNKIKSRAQNMFQSREISCSESISISNFKNSMGKMEDYGLVENRKVKDKQMVKVLNGDKVEEVIEVVQKYLNSLV